MEGKGVISEIFKPLSCSFSRLSATFLLNIGKKVSILNFYCRQALESITTPQKCLVGIKKKNKNGNL